MMHRQRAWFWRWQFGLLALMMLGFFLRIYRIDTVPATLNRDEAALAYNGLLLAEVGLDEWGRPWPLSLESFGDYKLPGYAWSLIPSFWLFGYTDMAVRLPSAVAGTVLIGLLFLLMRKLEFTPTSSWYGALVVTLSPLFIFYSRMAWEANVALALMVLMIYCWLAGWQAHQQQQRVGFLWDGLCICLGIGAIFTYNTPLFIIPGLMVLTILTRGWRSVGTWLPVVVGLGLVVAGGAYQLVALSVQKQGITIFADETIWAASVAYRQQFSGIWQSILGNRYLFWLHLMMSRFIASFSPQFVVWQGGTHPWHQLPGFGHLHMSTYVLAWLGMGSSLMGMWSALMGGRRCMWRWWLMWFLLPLSLAPAVITVDAPHATRSLLFFVLLTLMSAEGVEWLAAYIGRSRRLSKQAASRWLIVLLLVIVGALAGESVRSIRALFVDYPGQSAQILRAGFDRALLEVDQLQPTGQVAIVDDEGFHYIMTAWYGRFSAIDFLTTVVRQQSNSIGFKYGEQLGRFHFIAHEDDRSLVEESMIRWTGYQWEVVR